MLLFSLASVRFALNVPAMVCRESTYDVSYHSTKSHLVDDLVIVDEGRSFDDRSSGDAFGIVVGFVFLIIVFGSGSVTAGLPWLWATR